jgi:hypothetical protein
MATLALHYRALQPSRAMMGWNIAIASLRGSCWRCRAYNCLRLQVGEIESQNEHEPLATTPANSPKAVKHIFRPCRWGGMGGIKKSCVKQVCKSVVYDPKRSGHNPKHD